MASKRPGSSDSVLPVAVHELAETLSGLFYERFEQVFEWESGWHGFYENVEIPRAAVLRLRPDGRYNKWSAQILQIDF